jgi:hypothetical protein
LRHSCTQFCSPKCSPVEARLRGRVRARMHLYAPSALLTVSILFLRFTERANRTGREFRNAVGRTAGRDGLEWRDRPHSMPALQTTPREQSKPGGPEGQPTDKPSSATELNALARRDGSSRPYGRRARRGKRCAGFHLSPIRCRGMRSPTAMAVFRLTCTSSSRSWAFSRPSLN